MPRAYRFRPAVIVALGVAIFVMHQPARGQAIDEAADADLLRPHLLNADPRSPPRFRRQRSSRSDRFERPTYGVPPASGAGVTGFDSRNPRSRPTRRARTAATAASLRPSVPLAASAAPPPVAQVRTSPQLSRAGARANARAPLPPLSAGVQPAHRRPRPDEDPYEQLGIRVGGLVLRPALEVMVGHDSNPQRTRVPEGSTAMTIAPELLVRSNWSRHALNADIRATYLNYFQEFTPDLSRPLVDSRVNGRIDVHNDSRVDLEGRLLVATDNPGSPNISAGLARLPIFTRPGATAGYAHRFNRLEIAARGMVDRTDFQHSELTDGSSASNDDRNLTQYGGALRGSYDLLPGVRPFAEISADTRIHDVAIDRTGTQRDSVGQTVRAGTTFELSQKLIGEVSAGYLARNYDDPSLRSLSGLIFDASLIWRASALSTVTLTARSAADEVIVAGTSGVLRRDFAITLDHAFRRWLIGTVRVAYGSDLYVGSTRDDDRYAISAGLTYKLTRTLQIRGELRRDWLKSTDFSAESAATVALVGFRLQR